MWFAYDSEKEAEIIYSLSRSQIGVARSIVIVHFAHQWMILRISKDISKGVGRDCSQHDVNSLRWQLVRGP